MKDMILADDQKEAVIVGTQNKLKRKRCRGVVHIISEPEEKNIHYVFFNEGA